MHSLQDFEIDEQSAEFLSLHPLAKQAAKKHPSLIEEHFEPIMEEDEEGSSDSEDAATSQDDFEKNKKKVKKNSKGVR